MTNFLTEPFFYKSIRISPLFYTIWGFWLWDDCAEFIMSFSFILRPYLRQKWLPAIINFFFAKSFNNRPLQDHIQGSRLDLNLCSSEFQSFKSSLQSNFYNTIHIYSWANKITSFFYVFSVDLYFWIRSKQFCELFLQSLFKNIIHITHWQKHNQVIGVSK